MLKARQGNVALQICPFQGLIHLFLEKGSACEPVFLEVGGWVGGLLPCITPGSQHLQQMSQGDSRERDTHTQSRNLFPDLRALTFQDILGAHRLVCGLPNHLGLFLFTPALASTEQKPSTNPAAGYPWHLPGPFPSLCLPRRWRVPDAGPRMTGCVTL